MIMRSLAMTVVAAAFLLFCTLAAMFGTLLADREVPVALLKADLLTPVVDAGGELRVRFTVHRFRACALHVDRVIRDFSGNRQPLEDIDTKLGLDPLGIDTFITTLPVPAQLRPGPAVYSWATQYACNFVHQYWPIAGPVREIRFTVRSAVP